MASHLLFHSSNPNSGGMNQYEIIEDMNEAYRCKLPEPDPKYPEKVRRATAYIHHILFAGKLTVNWMMKQCLITNHNFSTVFAWYFGRTPEQYILYHRITEAEQLLWNTALADARLTDIVLSLGFHSLSAFDAAFKRHTGFTPSAHRRKYHMEG